jgi:hypothetical protein
MRGMHRWLWEVFAVVVVAYCLYLSPRLVLWAAGIVFIGGGLLLTIFGYLAAKYSMPRPADFWLQLWYPDSKFEGERMSPAKLFLFRMIYWPVRPKDSTQ